MSWGRVGSAGECSTGGDRERDMAGAGDLESCAGGWQGWMASVICSDRRSFSLFVLVFVESWGRVGGIVLYGFVGGAG